MSIYQIISSGLSARRHQIDTVANNIANISTTGFKATRLVLQDRRYQQSPYLGGSSPDDPAAAESLRLGSGAMIAGAQLLLDQGALRETGRSLDLAIQGAGYFHVEQGAGRTAFTRDGSFHTDANGYLMTATGDRLVPPVAIPADAVRIEVRQDGQVLVERGQPGAPQAVGHIQLTTFANPAGLMALGGNLFGATAAAGPARAGAAGTEGRGTIHGGALETSNVDFAAEMTRLVQAQRAYQMNLRLLQTWDEMAGMAASLRR